MLSAELPPITPSKLATLSVPNPPVAVTVIGVPDGLKVRLTPEVASE